MVGARKTRKHMGLTALFLLALAGAQPLPNESSCDLPTERETNLCIENQAKAWDRTLNLEYKAALKRVTDDQRPLLIKAQRAWIEYRDDSCTIQAAHGGTVAAYLQEHCILAMTRDRAKELHGLHDEDDD
jgi:uncharacterized protein YecT (DUF1311 family)